MPDYDPDARQKLLNLLLLRLGQDLDYDEFRIAVEEIYNFELDHSSLPEKELKIFEKLFDAVARYSPFPEDRAAYPTIYKDEKQIDEVVELTRRDLGLNARQPGEA